MFVKDSFRPGSCSGQGVHALDPCANSARPASSDWHCMVTRRAFWWFFALGFVLVPLNTPFLLGNIPLAHGVLSLLTTPGVVITLPLHNVVPGGGWGVVGLIALANGLGYGFAARLIVRVRGRRNPSARM